MPTTAISAQRPSKRRSFYALLAVLVGLGACIGSRAEEVPAFRFDNSATPPLEKLQGTATAFVVAPGLLLTSAHAVKNGGAQVFVRDVDTALRVHASVLAQDASVDLALLRASVNSPALPIGYPSDVETLAPVAVIGFPDPASFGETRKLAKGSVASLAAPGRPYLFTMNIFLRGGNSGSPVLARNGRVVGVAAGGFTSPVLVNGVSLVSQSVGASVRIEEVLAFLQKNHVAYQQFGYSGDIDDIAQVMAPSVFLLEVASD